MAGHGAVILGAGVSGLLAASRWPDARVFERQSAAVPPVMQATFYSEHRVPVFAEHEIVVYTRYGSVGTPEDYARKVYADPSVPVSAGTFRPWQAAFGWDGRELLAASVGRVAWERTVAVVDVAGRMLVLADGERVSYGVLINTIPLPVFLRMAGIECSAPLRSLPIFLRKGRAAVPIPPGEQHVVYWPGPERPYYRTSQRGGQLTEEHMHPPAGPVVVVLPGKIFPVPSAETLVASLEAEGIICLGRYAEWKPKLLSHQVWGRILDLRP